MKLWQLISTRQPFRAGLAHPIAHAGEPGPSSAPAARIAALLAVAVLAIVPDLALAGPWDSVAQNVLDIFTGGLTRTIAIIAVIVCGLMAFFGKMQWSWAINIIIGIVLVFGSTTVVDYIITAAS
jgi:type IV secretory pathway VirB2 component (pilin)